MVTTLLYVLGQDQGGHWFVEVPSLHGMIAWGATEQEAIEVASVMALERVREQSPGVSGVCLKRQAFM